MRAAITAFDAFGELPFNPSEEVVEALRRDPPVGGFDDVEFFVLPTRFRAVDDWIETRLPLLECRLILMLGVSAPSPSFRLERCALNIVDARIADNDGAQPQGAPIAADAPDALTTALDLHALQRRLSEEGAPFEISNHAGAYVCNYIYFKALDALGRLPRRADALFVHVPMTPPIASRADFARAPLDLYIERIAKLLRALRGALDMPTA